MRPVLILIALWSAILLKIFAGGDMPINIGSYLKDMRLPYGIDEVTEKKACSIYGEGIVKHFSGERRHIYFDPKSGLWLQLSFNTDDKTSVPLFECLVSLTTLAEKKVSPAKPIEIPKNILDLIGMRKGKLQEKYSLQSSDMKLSRGPKIQGEILTAPNLAFYVDGDKVVAVAVDNLP